MEDKHCDGCDNSLYNDGSHGTYPSRTIKSWYAVEILSDGSSTMEVDWDADMFIKRLAIALKAEDEITGILVGKVNGVTAEDAINSIRMDEWDKTDYYGEWFSAKERAKQCASEDTWYKYTNYGRS